MSILHFLVGIFLTTTSFKVVRSEGKDHQSTLAPLSFVAHHNHHHGHHHHQPYYRIIACFFAFLVLINSCCVGGDPKEGCGSSWLLFSFLRCG
jgi:hypothetical protein